MADIIFDKKCLQLNAILIT